MNALDVEQSAPLRRRPVRAAGSENGHDSTASQIPMGPPGLPARHPLNIFKRTAIIGGTLYAMHGACVNHDVRCSISVVDRFSMTKLCTYSCFASSSIDFNVFHNILHNPKISHEWFKGGLALSIAIMSLKAYVELYEGKTRNKKVEYENFKTATHITIFLIMGAWISFHMALSPVYGGFKTWIVMVGFSYGVLIQSSLFIPVWGQNFLSVVVMTVFLQQYK